LARIFHTLSDTLLKELKDCETVLDLGCGPSSPVQYCSHLRRTVGVEPFLPYYEHALKRGTHSELIQRRIEEVDFAEKSFDAVVIIEVIEHLDDQSAIELLSRAERWAKKKVIVTSPNGFVPQEALDGNELQRHLSGWPLERMKKLGFHSRGLAGLRWLRRDVHSGTMADDLLASVRFQPKVLWFVVAALSQIVTFHLPLLAFGLFSVKHVQRDGAC